MATVRIVSGEVRELLGLGLTAIGFGLPVRKDSPNATFQLVVRGTGAVSATASFLVSNDGVNWCQTPMGIVSISGTNSASDGFTTTSPWKFVLVSVTAISGTGATVTATISS